jgi:tetratricopeptide (TPR) repeat protein
MQVFISWSGPRSKVVAQNLRQWLHDVIQFVEPWMSAEDIQAGARWNDELSTTLQQIRFGIICLTPENQQTPWILFEAGALAKTIEKTNVCPYLIGMEPNEVSARPLTQFQTKRANRDETWELLCSINERLDGNSLPEKQLERTFERWWPDLEKVLKTLSKTEEIPERKPASDEMLGEILEGIRRIERSISSITATYPSFSRKDDGHKESETIVAPITSLASLSELQQMVYKVSKDLEHNRQLNEALRNGMYLRMNKRYLEAVHWYEKACIYDPNNTEAQIGLAVAKSYAEPNDLSEPLRILDRIIERGSDAAEAWYNRACIRCLSEPKWSKEQWLQDLKEALRLQPSLCEFVRRDEDFQRYWEDSEFLQVTTHHTQE